MYFIFVVDASKAVGAVLSMEQGVYVLNGQDARLIYGKIMEATRGNYALSGQPATLIRTRYVSAATGAFTLSGQDAGLLRGLKLTASQGFYVLNGQDAQFIRDYALATQQGTYALSGQDAALLRSLVLAAEQGNYALIGQNATIGRQLTLGAEAGDYELVGQDAGFVRDLALPAAQGLYEVFGQEVALLKSSDYVLLGDPGMYALGGQVANLLFSHALFANQGTYALAGQDARFLRDLILTADAGNYALTGQSAILARQIALAAAQGSYALNGQSAALGRQIALAATQGTYALSGQVADLRRSPLLAMGQGTYALAGQAAAFVRKRNLRTILDELSLSSGLKLCLDPGDITSWPGSGQKWLDLSGGGYDFFRGANNTATTDDPTFNGSAGALTSSEFVSFDGGDYFTYDTTNETWMNNLHKDNAKSAAFCWLYMTATGGNVPIFGLNGGTIGANIGASFLVGSTQNLVFRCAESGAVNGFEIDSGASTIPLNQWVCLAYNHDEAGGAGQTFVYYDGAVTTANGAIPTPNAGNATFTMQLGARGNNNSPALSGTRMGMLAIWEGVNLSASNFDAIRTQTALRGF